MTVKKANGELRFRIDYRDVNEATKKDSYPILNMVAISDKFRNARFISKIDLTQAYYQISLPKESCEITVFAVPGLGLFRFMQMPLGLTNPTAIFQRLIDSLIGPKMEPLVFAYLDGVVIVSEVFTDHIF